MKTVYLFRHGDSEESGFELDYCRKLTDEGKLRSEEMAEHLKKIGCRPDLIMTSGALRAKTTACIAAKTFGYPESEIVIEDIIYESKKTEEILPLIMNSSTKISGIMIVGHNPLLSEFLKYITGSSADISMKKSSVIRIDFKNKEWNSIVPGSGKTSFYKIFVNGGIVDAADEHS
jgi:phosphohistidine phosphatase